MLLAKQGVNLQKLCGWRGGGGGGTLVKQLMTLPERQVEYGSLEQQVDKQFTLFGQAFNGGELSNEMWWCQEEGTIEQTRNTIDGSNQMPTFGFAQLFAFKSKILRK